MLGRKDYTPEEVAAGKSAVAAALATFRKLAAAAPPPDGFEALFFNNMVVVLDRYFIYRLRVVTGKDTNPLNEVEMLVDSLMSNGGVLRKNNIVKYVPADSVLKLRPGDRVALTAADFERLSTAFFADLERKFL